MTWIRTVPLAEAGDKFKQLLQEQHALYPPEYNEPVPGIPRGPGNLPGIVASHTLIPEALYHAFSTFGVLMSPKLPLSRRHHEIITTMVSVTNRCVY
jgi:hypothetical protein